MNAFVSNVAKNAVIAGQSSKDFEIFYWAYLESVHIAILALRTFPFFPHSSSRGGLTGGFNLAPRTSRQLNLFSNLNIYHAAG